MSWLKARPARSVSRRNFVLPFSSHRGGGITLAEDIVGAEDVIRLVKVGGCEAIGYPAVELKSAFLG